MIKDRILAKASGLAEEYRWRILKAVEANRMDEARKFNDMVHGMTVLKEQLELLLKEEE